MLFDVKYVLFDVKRVLKHIKSVSNDVKSVLIDIKSVLIVIKAKTRKSVNRESINKPLRGNIKYNETRGRKEDYFSAQTNLIKQCRSEYKPSSLQMIGDSFDNEGW